MHNFSYLFRFHPRNEASSCLKGACGCANTIYRKSATATLFNYFFRKQFLKNLTLILLRVRQGGTGDPNSYFLGSGTREN